MRVTLFANEWPSGRCLLLARELVVTTRLDAGESLRAAESLFSMNHSVDNPLEIDLLEDADTTHLQQLCDQFGIVCSV